MKNVTVAFKTDIRTYGRQLDFKIKINDVADDTDNYNYLKPAFHSSLFKTIMHELEIDTKNSLAKGTKINVQAGVKLNEEDYNYITYNSYFVKDCERQEDTNSFIVKAYDKMLESMIDYDLELTEKIKLRSYLLIICNRMGWNTENIPAIFINSEKLIDPNLHRGIGYTFRDALDEIATLSCSFLLFINDDFHLIYTTETNESIDETYLNEDSVTIGEKYFINSLVFARAEESDNIFRKDDTSIEKDGLHEYRISDNQLLSTNDRDLYIDEMFEYLKTFEFYIFDIKTKGILFLEPCDKFSFNLGDIEYSTILLNSEVSFDNGLTEDIYTEKSAESETEYKYADSTDMRINQAYILVDKQNLKIQQLTNESSEHEEKLSIHEQDINGLKQSVSNNIDYKREAEGTTEIYLENAGNTNILKFEINGNKTYESNLFTRTNLQPRQALYPNQKGG